jgi:hypothetical protein
MKKGILVTNISNKPVKINGVVFPVKQTIQLEVDTALCFYRDIRANHNLRDMSILELEATKMKVSVFNKLHFTIKVGEFTFPPFKETFIDVFTTSGVFRDVRCIKGLRVGKVDNPQYAQKYIPKQQFRFNMVYDVYSQHRGGNYIDVVKKLAAPIVKYLPKAAAGFVDRPCPGLNLRFFSSQRINQQGKYPVGPYDVFMSHGIGDKGYWAAENICDFKYVLVPGPAWKEKILAGGYKGDIFEVGYTKLDPIFNGEYQRQKYAKPVVVWAPTHGYNNKHRGRSSYPWCVQLIDEIPGVYEKILALHPTSKVARYQKQDATLQELLDADVVIADAGSTLYEAWALGKPVIFPDWLCKKDVMGHFQSDNLEYQIYDKQIGYHAKDMKHLIKLIDTALEKGMGEAETEFIENVFPSKFRGCAGEKAAQALIEINADMQKGGGDLL